MPYERELAVALEAAALATSYLKAEYAAFAMVPDAPASISTHADRESQEIILKHLHAAFPLDGLVAEEKTPTLAASPVNPTRQWVVDPIDGTRGFAMKNGEYSTMIGLTVNGKPVVGVVGEPSLDRLTYAVEGGGCWRKDGDGEAMLCAVTSTSRVGVATLTQSHSNPAKPPKPVVRRLQPGKVVETYSAGIKLAQVARGEVDLYVNDYPEFHDWDVCAGEVLVVEAGGVVSEHTGDPVRYGIVGAKRKSGLLASNGVLHAEAIQLLTKDVG